MEVEDPEVRTMPANRNGLAAYVTSHGFGHLNRTVSVLNRLPGSIPIVVRCRPDLFPHWRERLRRPARLEPHESDVGALNPPGDSAATDGPGTLARAAEVHVEAMCRMGEEADRLRDEGTAAVLVDAPAPPLVAARIAGIPGHLLANFTWADIYEPHARKAGGGALAFVADLKRAYRQAAVLFRTEPALKMADLAASTTLIDVGMVLTPGRDRRTELRGGLKLPASARLVAVYLGRYGQDCFRWDRLKNFADVQFVSFHPAPASVGEIPNLHVVAPEDWTGSDLAASVDAVVAKAGYGSACEAMSAGTPLIYPPRSGFAEHRALDRCLRAWDGGLPASSRDFDQVRLGPLLDRAFARKPGPAPFPADGAARVAEHLEASCQAGISSRAIP